MMFDKLCGVAEAHFSQAAGFLHKAKLFVIDKAAHTFIPKENPPEETEWLIDNFMMPFDIVAIEDPGGVIMLINTEKNQKGFSQNRLFIECPNLNNPDGFADGWKHDLIKTPMPDFTLVHFGQMRHIIHAGSGRKVFGQIDALYWVSKTEFMDIGKTHPDSVPYVSKITLQNVATAFEEIVYFNNPDFFLLESKPAGHRTKPSKRILRSHERSQYILLRPKQIRDRLRLPGPGTGHRTPHERRAHPRFLGSPFYKKKQGQRIMIPASWIGPSEATIKNRIYKVRLDL